VPNATIRKSDRFSWIDAGPATTPSAGERPQGVLVLIHAFPVHAGMWHPQLALATRGWRMIAPFLRGFGTSSPDSAGTSMDDYAADVIDLLDMQHVHEAVIGGVSMGGYVAFALFRRAPRYFRGMILADTRAPADTPEGVEGRKRMLQLLQDKGPQGVADDMIPKLLGESTRRTRPDLVELVRGMVLENRSQAIAGAIRALMTRPDSTPLLDQIHCPTLVLVGDEDTVTPRPAAEELHRGIAGSELVVVPRAGHLSNLEQPDAFNDALAGFLEHRV
jgi:pimeloyl-ACP methyl ester carboxylesterase